MNGAPSPVEALQPNFSVSYRLCPSDYWRLNVYCLFHVRKAQESYLYILSLFAGICILVGWTRQLSLPAITANVAVVVVLFVVIQIVLIYWKIKNAYKGVDHRAGERYTLYLDESGVRAECEHQEIKRAWNLLADVRRTRDYIYIFVSPTWSYIIPVEAFAGSSDADAFAAYAHARLRASKA